MFTYRKYVEEVQESDDCTVETKILSFFYIDESKSNKQ